MKITIKEQTEREVEVTFPSFKKTICHNMMAISETEFIMVTRGGACFSVQKFEYIIPSFFTDEDSNESEFMEAYNEVQELFKGILL